MLSCHVRGSSERFSPPTLRLKADAVERARAESESESIREREIAVDVTPYSVRESVGERRDSGRAVDRHLVVFSPKRRSGGVNPMEEIATHRGRELSQCV